MEYLSKSTKNPPSGDEMSFAMGTFGLAAFAAYTLFVTVPNKEDWVLKTDEKIVSRECCFLDCILLRGQRVCASDDGEMHDEDCSIFSSGRRCAIQRHASVGVIVFTHAAFCSVNAKKQCLSQTGAISAALVVSGGLTYAYQTSIANSNSGSSAPRAKGPGEN